MKTRANEHSARNRWVCQIGDCKAVVEAFDASVAQNAITDHLLAKHPELIIPNEGQTS